MKRIRGYGRKIGAYLLIAALLAGSGSIVWETPASHVYADENASGQSFGQQQITEGEEKLSEEEALLMGEVPEEENQDIDMKAIASSEGDVSTEGISVEEAYTSVSTDVPEEEVSGSDVSPVLESDVEEGKSSEQVVDSYQQDYEAIDEEMIEVPEVSAEDASGAGSMEMGAGSGMNTFPKNPAPGMTVGTEDILRIYYDNVPGVAYISADSSNDNVRTYWDGNVTGVLHIYGHKKGKSTLTLRLLDRNRNTLRIKYVTATVGASRAALTIPGSFQTLETGEDKVLQIGHQNVNYEVGMAYEIADPKICSAGWGNWNPSTRTRPLTVTGKRAGITRITLKLIKDQDTVLTEKSIYVTVISKTQLSVSASNLSMGSNETRTVQLTCRNLGEDAESLADYDGTCLDTEWGRWNNNGTCSFKIKGKKAGTHKLTFSLRAANDKKILATVSIQVAVTQKNATMKVSRNSLDLGIGQEEGVQITAEGNGRSIYVSCDYDDRYLEIRAGGWSGQKVPFYIKGARSGSTTITFYLKEAGTNRILAEKSITVRVANKASMDATKKLMSVRVGESQTTRITTNSGGDNSGIILWFPDNDNSYASYQYGTWDARSVEFTFTGKQAGIWLFPVKMIRRTSGGDVELASINLKIAVLPRASKLTPSQTDLRMKPGEERSIDIGVSGLPDGGTMNINDTFPPYLGVTAQWTSQDNIRVNLKALGKGSTYFTLWMTDASKNTVKSVNIYVTISEKGVYDYSYNFSNTNTGFGRQERSYYRIPYSAYQRIYGDTQRARDLFNASGGWIGSCFGMVLTAELFGNGSSGPRPSSFRSGASRANDLAYNSYSSAERMNVTEYIEAMQVSQSAESLKSVRFASWNNLESLCNALKQSAGTPMEVSMWSNNVGHTVLAYRIEDAITSARIYIYDPNKPNEIQYITVGRQNGSYVSWNYDGYGSNQRNAEIHYTEYDDHTAIWKNHGTLNGMRGGNLMIANSRDLEVRDYKNQVVATITDGKLETNNKDIYLSKITDAGNDTAPSYLYLPTDMYIVKNKDANVSSFHVLMSDMEQSAEVETEAAEVLLSVDDSDKINEVQIRGLDPGQAYAIRLNSTIEGDKAVQEISGTGNTQNQKIGVSVDELTRELRTQGCLGAAVSQDGDIGYIGEDGKLSADSVHKIELTFGKGGKTRPRSEAIVEKGDTKTVRFLPDQGYEVEDILIDGKSVGAKEEYTFENVSEDHTVYATFKSSGSESSNSEKQDSDSIPVKSLKLSGISKKIAAGKKIKLSAQILPENATDSRVIWESANKKLATVSKGGTVTVNKKAGGKTVVITATAADGSGWKATYKISVVKGAVKKITLLGKQSVKAGSKLKLKAKVQATRGANKKLLWISGNENYASVNSKGTVTAKAEGKGKKVKITAMATDGTGKKKTVTVKIK